MPGRWYSGLFEIATAQNGFITTDDARARRRSSSTCTGTVTSIGSATACARSGERCHPVCEVHVRDLDRGDVTRFEGIPVVTPSRAILDGVERHLGRRLIDQAIETARDRGLVTRYELAALEAVD